MQQKKKTGPGLFQQTFHLHFQAFNESMKASDKRMTAERCGYLSLIAIAHKLEEAWICFFPVLPLMYISQYLPTIGKRYYCNTTRFLLPASSV